MASGSVAPSGNAPSEIEPAEIGPAEIGPAGRGPAGTSEGARWSAGLDAAQRRAVEHEGGPLLIVAGAGTGKTRTLVARLARLIEDGSVPERILLVTFSRRAAEEMTARLGPLVGAEVARRVHAGTFHAVAHRLLSRHGAALGLGAGFSVLDAADAADLMHLARHDGVPEDAAGRRFPRKDTLLSVYSRIVNAGEPLGPTLKERFPWLVDHEAAIAAVFTAYTERKRAHRLLDFDDLLLYWRAATADPAVGPAMAAAYDHVLVDEYQDTNVIQAQIVRALRPDGRPVTVVGDDAQAIYSFRAAEVRNMWDFATTFPGSTTVTLDRNHRSTQPILDLVNLVVAGATEGFGPQLWTEAGGGGKPVLATCPDEMAEAAAVADVVLEHHEAGVALREQAVLFRSAHHSDALELELRRRRIPFVKYGGLRFLDTAHGRDLLAALRILDNPRDELAWFRVLQLLDGVGPAGARRVLAALGVGAARAEPVESAPPGAADDPPATGDPVADDPADAADPLARFLAGLVPLPARARPDAAHLAAALADCRGGDLAPGGQVERLGDGLAPMMRRRYPDAEVRLRDVPPLARLAGAYDTRARLVAELTLDPPVSTGDLAGEPHLDDDYLVLSTVHSAKGAEWRVVHVIHASDGMFPSDLATGRAAEIDEERRLFYVAVTRAREHLYLYVPLRYHHGGLRTRRDAHSWAQRSRFLPPSADPLLDHRPVRARPFDVVLPAAAAPLASAVDRVLQDLW